MRPKKGRGIFHERSEIPVPETKPTKKGGGGFFNERSEIPVPEKKTGFLVQKICINNNNNVYL